MPVMYCGCPNEQQDRIHGGGMRVFNKKGGKNASPNFSCTSCGNTKGAATTVAKPAKPAK